MAQYRKQNIEHEQMKGATSKDKIKIAMHQNAKKGIVVVKHLAEHGGKTVLKYNVGEPISSYRIEWNSFIQNQHICRYTIL